LKSTETDDRFDHCNEFGAFQQFRLVEEH